VSRPLSTALSGKDVEGFYTSIRKYLIIIVFAAPLFAFYHYVQNLVALEWRLWLTRLLLNKYFANHAYFNLKAEAGMGADGYWIWLAASSDGVKLRKSDVRLMTRQATFGTEGYCLPSHKVFLNSRNEGPTCV